MPRPDELYHRILAAASNLLAVEGPSALRVRRIAEAAGTSTMGVYTRFGGKEGVVNALYLQGFQGLLNEMRSVVATDDPLADLAEQGRAYRRYALSHATHYQVMFGGAVPGFQPEDDAIAVASATFEALVTAVRRALDAGLLSGGTAEQLAYVCWAQCHGLVSLELADMGDDHPACRAAGHAGAASADWLTEVYEIALGNLVDGRAPQQPTVTR
jgi:AcrR family transcriptional regulator